MRQRSQETAVTTEFASAVQALILGLLILPWFVFLEISTGIGSNSSLLALSPHDIRKVGSVMKE